MKEELITFDTAELAKKKGFDLKTKNWYDQTECLNPMKGIRGAMCYHNVGYAPTQSLLAKWLREEHGIIVNIVSTNGEAYALTVHRKSKEEFTTGLFKTHELALEKGLIEALTLIKKKKNKTPNKLGMDEWV